MMEPTTRNPVGEPPKSTHPVPGEVEFWALAPTSQADGSSFGWQISHAIVGCVTGFGAFFVTAVVVVGAALGGAGLAFAYLCPAASGVFAGWVLGRRGHRWTGFAISYLLAYGIGLLVGEWMVNGITDATEPPPFVPDFRPMILVLAAFAVTYVLVRVAQRGEASGAPSPPR